MVKIFLLFWQKIKSKQFKQNKGLKSLKHLRNMSDLRKRGYNVVVNNNRRDQSEDEAANSLEYAMKLLKKVMFQDGFQKELRKREFYQSKGQKARRARQNAVMRERKRLTEERREWDPDSLIGVHQNKRKKKSKK